MANREAAQHIEITFPEEQAGSFEMKPIKPLQDQIIREFTDSDDPDFDPSQLAFIKPPTAEEREDFVLRLANGELDDEMFERIKTVSNDVAGVNEKQLEEKATRLSSSDPINVLLRGRVEGLEKLSPGQKLAEFVKQFPDPATLEVAEEEFIKQATKGMLDPSVRESFVERQLRPKLEQFKHDVYGRQQVFWEQVKLLRNEGEALIESGADAGKDKIAFDTEQIARLRQEMRTPQIEQIDQATADLIMGDTRIAGDTFRKEKLSVDALKEAGLGPAHHVQVEGRDVFLSEKPFDLGDGRVGMIAYVKDEKGYVARSFYRSNSHGTWKYLPAFRTNKEGKISRYDKGYGGESITLPIALQKTLSEVMERTDQPVKVKDAEKIFIGTARHRVGSDLESTYYGGMSTQPESIPGTYDQEDFSMPNPEKMEFENKEQEPDLTVKLAEWSHDTQLYGRVKNEVYPSQDGNLLYVFSSDAVGRTWISSIEKQSEMTSMGIRKDWVSGEYLTTPAYEYMDTVPYKYHNFNDVNGDYIDVFEKFLSKIPIIKKYVEMKREEEALAA
ncbi:hypothetical protein ACFL2D_00280 [Patescibacteria group bacterium]